VGCATGTGDDHLDATAFGLFGILEQQIRGAVGGNHLHFVGMPSFSSISAVWLRVDQSDLEPMITPTSALIVEPLLSGRPQARQKQQAEIAWLDCTKNGRTYRPKAAQYTAKCNKQPRNDHLSRSGGFIDLRSAQHKILWAGPTWCSQHWRC
jgi:hypothetical protein